MTFRRCLPLPLVGIALFLSVTAPLAAAAPRWAQTNLFGGRVEALAQAPSDPQLLYAAVSYATREMFRSLDGGATWHARGQLPIRDVLDLTVDPFDTATIYLRGYGQPLHRTRDGGLTWVPLPGLEPPADALAAEGGPSGALWAATREGLFRSADRGESWQVHAAFAGSPVRGITIEPGGGTLLVAVRREEDSALFFWRSRDHGATWEPVSLLVPGETSGLNGYPHIAFDLSRPGTLYVWFFEREGDFFHEGPLFRSRDGGVTWTELTSPVWALRDLVPLSDGTLLAGSASQGATRSFDQGDSWLPGSWQHPVPNASVIRIVALPGDRRTLVAAGDGGVWRSTDGGETWVASNQGLAAIGVGSFLAAPTEPSFLIARAGDAVFRSADHGATWTRIEAEFPWRWLESLKGFDPRHPRTVFAFGSDDRLADVLFKSTNAGRTWQSLPVPYSCTSTICWVIMRAFAVDPQNPDTLFVGGEYFYRYGTVSDFLVRSDDDFATTEELTPIHGLRALAVVSGKPDTLYGLNCRRLYRSQDGAKTWQRMGRGLPLRLCPREGWDGRGSLVLDPRDPERLYVGTAGKGVYASTDGGLTFNAMNRGLETAGVTTILIDPTDSTKLYAGTDGQGVFRWSAKWKTWAPLNDGLPTAWFRGLLAIDPRRPTVLYAGASTGIFRISLGEVP